MPKDRLEVVDDWKGNFRLQWWLAEDEDYGAVVGEAGKPPTEDQNDAEWYTAEVVCFKLHEASSQSDTFGLDVRGFWWASKKQAAQVLAKIRTEIQVALDKKGPEAGWPEWAITAKAHGWKPPKGWKP